MSWSAQRFGFSRRPEVRDRVEDSGMEIPMVPPAQVLMTADQVLREMCLRGIDVPPVMPEGWTLTDVVQHREDRLDKSWCGNRRDNYWPVSASVALDDEGNLQYRSGSGRTQMTIFPSGQGIGMHAETEYRDYADGSWEYVPLPPTDTDLAIMEGWKSSYSEENREYLSRRYWEGLWSELQDHMDQRCWSNFLDRNNNPHPDPGVMVYEKVKRPRVVDRKMYAMA